MPLIRCPTKELLDSLIQSCRDLLVTVHFSASWAPQCQQMDQVMLELEKLHPAARFVVVDAESVPELSEEYMITAVPTFILIKGGKEIDRLDGANAPVLTQKVAQHAAVALSAPVVAPPRADIPKEDINVRLKKLVIAAPVMLFMKGTADQPQCGFSRQMVELLRDVQAEFSTFNILADQEVREGLKKLSNWPTYPQLYVKGELVGGLDVVRELKESGELAEVLKPKISEADLNARLKALIEQDPVMVFIKGTPQAPRCGFTRQILELLTAEGAQFGYYDILGDNDVREGLKKYSNWPTFPQLYVKGELVGGLDILKELKEAGELRSTLNLE